MSSLKCPGDHIRRAPAGLMWGCARPMEDRNRRGREWHEVNDSLTDALPFMNPSISGLADFAVAGDCVCGLNPFTSEFHGAKKVRELSLVT